MRLCIKSKCAGGLPCRPAQRRNRRVGSHETRAPAVVLHHGAPGFHNVNQPMVRRQFHTHTQTATRQLFSDKRDLYGRQSTDLFPGRIHAHEPRSSRAGQTENFLFREPHRVRDPLLTANWEQLDGAKHRLKNHPAEYTPTVCVSKPFFLKNKKLEGMKRNAAT